MKSRCSIKTDLNYSNGQFSPESSFNVSVGKVGVEFNDSHHEVSMGPVAYGADEQPATYIAISEKDYYALDQAGVDPETDRKSVV